MVNSGFLFAANQATMVSHAAHSFPIFKPEITQSVLFARVVARCVSVANKFYIRSLNVLADSFAHIVPFSIFPTIFAHVFTSAVAVFLSGAIPPHIFPPFFYFAISCSHFFKAKFAIDRTPIFGSARFRKLVIHFKNFATWTHSESRQWDRSFSGTFGARLAITLPTLCYMSTLICLCFMKLTEELFFAAFGTTLKERKLLHSTHLCAGHLCCSGQVGRCNPLFGDQPRPHSWSILAWLKGKVQDE
jgi:hypothetical protein